MKNKNVQVILNNEGIQTENVSFYEWSDIEGEDVIMKRTGNSASNYLVYDYPNGRVELSITDFNITKRKLETLLRVYRGRNAAKSDNLHKSTNSYVKN